MYSLSTFISEYLQIITYSHQGFSWCVFLVTAIIISSYFCICWFMIIFCNNICNIIYKLLFCIIKTSQCVLCKVMTHVQQMGLVWNFAGCCSLFAAHAVHLKNQKGKEIFSSQCVMWPTDRNKLLNYIRNATVRIHIPADHFLATEVNKFTYCCIR